VHARAEPGATQQMFDVRKASCHRSFLQAAQS
jgi:hypothetical protein